MSWEPTSRAALVEAIDKAEPVPPVTPQQIIGAANYLFGDIRGTDKWATGGRQVAMAVIRSLTNLSLAAIAHLFMVEQSTVGHACRRVTEDPKLTGWAAAVVAHVQRQDGPSVERR